MFAIPCRRLINLFINLNQFSSNRYATAGPYSTGERFRWGRFREFDLPGDGAG